MGVEYRGVICVGYDYDEITEIIDDRYDGDIYDFCEEVGISVFSPYFDAEYQDCIFGYKVFSSDDYCYEVIGDVSGTAAVQAGKLEKLLNTAKEAKTYLMAHGR